MLSRHIGRDGSDVQTGEVTSPCWIPPVDPSQALLDLDLDPPPQPEIRNIVPIRLPFYMGKSYLETD